MFSAAPGGPNVGSRPAPEASGIYDARWGDSLTGGISMKETGMDDMGTPKHPEDETGPSGATFGDRLATAREAQGLTQAQLARRLGLRVETVRNWETDRSEPRANRLQMLSGFLNVSMVWLMTGQGVGAQSIDAPSEVESDPAFTEALAELRDIRLAQLRLIERLGRLEKVLRACARGDED